MTRSDPGASVRVRAFEPAVARWSGTLVADRPSVLAVVTFVRLAAVRPGQGWPACPNDRDSHMAGRILE